MSIELIVPTLGESITEATVSKWLKKIGEPYIRSFKSPEKSKAGLGLGIFIGKTLLEKNFANIRCGNSKTRSGAEVNIKWNNKDLLSL